MTDSATLISRLVDTHDDTAWAEFHEAATIDPHLWRDLAETQHAHAQIARYVDHAAQKADAVDAFPRRSRMTTVRPWAGWAVAAGLLMVVTLLTIRPWMQSTSERSARAVSDASEIDALSAEQTLRHYLEKGKASGDVIAEIPTKALLDVRPADSGEGYDVIYLRPIIERTTVPDLYQFAGQDESGRPTLVRYNNHAPANRPH